MIFYKSTILFWEHVLVKLTDTVECSVFCLFRAYQENKNKNKLSQAQNCTLWDDMYPRTGIKLPCYARKSYERVSFVYNKPLALREGFNKKTFLFMEFSIREGEGGLPLFHNLF
jgi:hypothetical protein